MGCFLDSRTIGDYMTIQNATNLYGVAKWIVDPVLGAGTHMTIVAAMASASSGQTIFVRPGTYSGNFTWKAGVNICAFECDAITPNVKITGIVTITDAGSRTISGCFLGTPTPAILTGGVWNITGSAASIVNLVNCYIHPTTVYIALIPYFFLNSSGGAVLNLYGCSGDVALLYSGGVFWTQGGKINVMNSNMLNTGIANNGNYFQDDLTVYNSRMDHTLQLDTGGSLTMYNSSMRQTYAGSFNPNIILQNSITATLSNCTLYNNGTDPSCPNITFFSAATLNISNSTLNAVNSSTYCISGAGTVNYALLALTGSANAIDPNHYPFTLPNFGII